MTQSVSETAAGRPQGRAGRRASSRRSEPSEQRRGLSRRKLTILQVLTVLALLGAWEFVGTALGASFWVSRPTDIASTLRSWVVAGTLFTDLGVTLGEALAGFVIGAVLGSIVGFALGWARTIGDVLEPLILSLYTLPKIALAPLFVLWFGIGATTKVMFAALLVFFLTFFTTFQGTRNVDMELVENARVMGASTIDTWRKIAIPYSAIWMFTGLRIALPYAIIGAVVGEFIASQAGIGFRIQRSAEIYNTAGVFAGLLLLMVVAMVALHLLNLIERYVMRWREPQGHIGVTDTA